MITSFFKWVEVVVDGDASRVCAGVILLMADSSSLCKKSNVTSIGIKVPVVRILVSLGFCISFCVGGQ